MGMDKLLNLFDFSNFGANLKANIIKIFVIVVVAAFVFEMVALGYLGGTSNGNNTGASSAQNTSPLTVFGVITANGTVVSFDPVLYVSGADIGKASAVKDSLISKGLATYSVSPDNNTLLINLISESAVPQAALAFKGLNLSIYAPAQIQFTKNLDMVDANGVAYSLAPSVISYQLLPSIKKGSSILVSFDARGDLTTPGGTDYTLTGWGSVSTLPTQISFSANLPVLSKKSNVLAVQVPWAFRSNVSKAGVSAALAQFNSTKITYSKKSYIEFPNLLTQQQYNEINSKKPSYVTSLQADFAGVSDSFSDTSSIVKDLGLYGPAFPTSDIAVEISGNPSDAMAALSDYLKLQGVTSALVESNVYVLGVPDMLESAETNTTYSFIGSVKNITVNYVGDISDGSNISVLLNAYEVAGVIVDISGAVPIGAPSSGNALQTMPPLNSTNAVPGTGIPVDGNSSAGN